MDWQLPIYDGATQRGILTAQRQGLRTIFHVRCPKWGDGVYKIWLQGEREALLLGTLVPEGEVFTLERSISNAMLREKGVEHCAAAMVVSEGVAEAPPAERTGSEWRSTQGLEAAGAGGWSGARDSRAERGALASHPGGHCGDLSLGHRTAYALYAPVLFRVLVAGARRDAGLDAG